MLPARPSFVSTQRFSPEQHEVWKEEVKYWDMYTSGKIDEYMSLWDEDFLGWPPSTRATRR